MTRFFLVRILWRFEFSAGLQPVGASATLNCAYRSRPYWELHCTMPYYRSRPYCELHCTMPYYRSRPSPNYPTTLLHRAIRSEPAPETRLSAYILVYTHVVHMLINTHVAYNLIYTNSAHARIHTCRVAHMLTYTHAHIHTYSVHACILQGLRCCGGLTAICQQSSDAS